LGQETICFYYILGTRFSFFNEMADGKCHQSLQRSTWTFTLLNRDRNTPKESGHSEERKKPFPCPEYKFRYAGAWFRTSVKNHSSPWPQIRLHYASGTVWVNSSHFLRRSWR